MGPSTKLPNPLIKQGFLELRIFLNRHTIFLTDLSKVTRLGAFQDYHFSDK